METKENKEKPSILIKTLLDTMIELELKARDPKISIEEYKIIKKEQKITESIFTFLTKETQYIKKEPIYILCKCGNKLTLKPDSSSFNYSEGEYFCSECDILYRLDQEDRKFSR